MDDALEEDLKSGVWEAEGQMTLTLIFMQFVPISFVSSTSVAVTLLNHFHPVPLYSESELSRVSKMISKIV